MHSNPAVWFEIYVHDMERAKKFYESAFGYKLTKLDTPAPGIEMWGFPMEENKAGAGGALAKMDGVAPGGGGTLVYFACDDCAVEARKAAQNGGRIHMEKNSIGKYGYIALVVDTEGNMIGLHSM